MALFVTAISAPMFFWLRYRRVPEAIALLLVMLTVLLMGLVLSLMVGSSLDGFTSSLPCYQQRLVLISGQFAQSLAGFGIEVDLSQLETLVDLSAVMGFVGKSLNGVLATLANGFFIVLLVAFMLFELDIIAGKIRKIDGDSGQTLAQLEKSAATIISYFGIKTLMSLVTGMLVFLGLLLVGVDYPVLWGLVAFLFNFIPNIGSILASIPPLLLALIQLGPWAAVWVMAIFLFANSAIGNVLEPRLMGRQLGLSALVVFMSLVFWGWLLGPVGMFLSVPLTMTIKIVLDAHESTRWVAIMLGGEEAVADPVIALPDQSD
jgi:predicted PurR-regulated permease PerM